MSDHRDLRAILREADPAASSELSPAERARLKAAVLAAASNRRTAWHGRVVLKLAGALAVGVVAMVAARRTLQPEIPSRPSMATPRTAQVVAAPVEAVPSNLPAASPRPVRHLHPPPRVSAQAATRILFTAPEGTQILWFVGPPPATQEES